MQCTSYVDKRMLYFLMNLWFKRIYFVVFQLILLLQLSGISYGFFKIDIILNCEPMGPHYPDTYKNIRYFKFNKEEIELDWSLSLIHI